MSVTEIENLNEFHILVECGDDKGLRFQVWADASGRDERDYICSTDTREHGEQIVAAMVAASISERTPKIRKAVFHP